MAALLEQVKTMDKIFDDSLAFGELVSSMVHVELYRVSPFMKTLSVNEKYWDGVTTGLIEDAKAINSNGVGTLLRDQHLQLLHYFRKDVHKVKVLSQHSW